MTAQVCIGEAHSRYRLPPGMLAPERTRRELDALLRDRVCRLAGQSLTATLPADEGVVLVRRLDLRLAIGGEPSAEAIARAWSRALGGALARGLAGPGSDGVIRFRSMAAYLASFASDVATGGDPERWYYRPLVSRPGLGASDTIRAALLEHADALAETLASLARSGALDGVCATLTAAAADELVRALYATRPISERRDGMGLAPAVAAAARRLAAAPARAELYLAGQLEAAGRPLPVRSELTTAIRALLGAAGGVARPSVLRPGDLALVGGGDGDAAPNAVAAHGMAVPSSPSDAGGRSAIDPVDGLVSPYAGVFLLLGSLAELPVAALLERPSRDAEADQLHTAVLRWLVLLAALGPAHRPFARHDPALLLAAGLTRSPAPEAVRSLGRELSVRAGRRIAPAVGAWADRTGRRHGPASDEQARVPGFGTVAVSRDVASGLWLSARRRRASGGPAGTAPPALGPRLPPIDADLAHLSLGAELPGPAARLAVAHLAALAGHGLARRLPGFGLSSAAYIARNLLVGPGAVRLGPDGVRMRLPEVPLRVALLMAGWREQREPVPWLPGGALVLGELTA